MTHLTIDQLVELREPGMEPGVSAAREHLLECPVCRMELERLHQRVARLKALPPLRPARSQWPAVRSRVVAARRRQHQWWVAAGAFGLAASLALVTVVHHLTRPSTIVAELSDVMARSHQLEQTLDSYNADGRVTDGLTAQVAGALEDRIASVDRQLEMAQMLDRAAREDQLLRLWRERVGLLDALVDVHVTRASNVGL
jgi:hypothetical protein